MVAIIICIWFVFLAAFFNAVMDATENDPNFNESILKNLNRQFWLKTISWQYARKLFGYKFDAWHIAKTCMVFSIAGAVISAVFIGVYLASNPSIWFVFAGISAIGISWNGSFKLFYHVIFKVK